MENERTGGFRAIGLLVAVAVLASGMVLGFSIKASGAKEPKASPAGKCCPTATYVNEKIACQEVKSGGWAYAWSDIEKVQKDVDAANQAARDAAAKAKKAAPPPSYLEITNLGMGDGYMMVCWAKKVAVASTCQ